ncbi:hypothetical protein N7468_008844 [Penicillium chermesinum]|uniref:Uncharacterized protein n=1 Tax=Penicillium chermesinum TaxID=63820 RepID=A0A9W9NGN5_9EURO|nr:uncharacterized protein N7468_008844 [Penicillium chermesinum]KAJ5219640.1 hypothetical protein N7468_008844 [Penicillium chermesinum]
MPPRRKQVVTADRLFQDMTAQMDFLSTFLEVDLTPAMPLSSATDRNRAIDLLPQGANFRPSIERLYKVCQWSSLAFQEEEWREEQGMERVCRGRDLCGVWPKPSFLRHLGLSDDHNVESDLKQGRKVRRLEAAFGPGTALLIVPIVPLFRVLCIREEAKLVELLRDNEHITRWAQKYEGLKQIYQGLIPPLTAPTTGEPFKCA